MPEIHKMLVLSTAHITKETADLLQHDGDLILSYEKREYGWFIPIIQDMDVTLGYTWPDDLAAIRAYATAYECTWIMLDRDADEIDGLPTYELEW